MRSIKNQIQKYILIFTIIPVIVTGVAALFISFSITKRSIENRNTALINSLVDQIGKNIEITNHHLSMARGIVESNELSPELKTGQLDLLLAQNQNIPISRFQYIDQNGLCTLTAPKNSALLGIDVSNRPFFKSVMENQKSYWSSSYISNETNTPIVTIATPALGGVLSADLAISSISRLVEDYQVEENGTVALIDSNGTYIAHSQQIPALQRNTDIHFQKIKLTPENSLTTFIAKYNGKNSVCYYKKIAQSDWIVLFYLPLFEIYKPILQLVGLVILLILIVIFLAGLLSSRGFKSLVTDFHVMNELYSGVETGDYAMELPEVHYEEFDSMIEMFSRMKRTVEDREISLKKSQERLQLSLEEKNMLIKEIHHRVKNNMQIIYSLLELQIDSLDSNKDKQLYLESQGRIKTMSMVHEILYGSDNFTHIRMDDYIIKLVEEIKSIYSDIVSVKVEYILCRSSFTLENAMPTGLIINEVVTNCLKHAFTDVKSGIIKIEMTESGDKTEIVIHDNGKGIGDNIDIRNYRTLGLQLIYNLAVQLKAEVTIRNDSGTRIMLTIPNKITAD